MSANSDWLKPVGALTEITAGSYFGPVRRLLGQRSYIAFGFGFGRRLLLAMKFYY
jgi:hypothetical protein